MSTNKYDSIIHLSHHQSETRPHMSMTDRAAQFSPFAAVVGYDSAVDEAARLTDDKIELDESQKLVLNEKLVSLKQQIVEGTASEATILYFAPDTKKAGGAYLSITAKIKKIDALRGVVVTDERQEVPMDDIIDLLQD